MDQGHQAIIEAMCESRMLYRGVPVVTLPMIDRAHNRPRGTARRTFNAHKGRLREGEDHFHVSPLSVERMRGVRSTDKGFMHGSDQVLVTEQGYCLLVKPFQDDLAWEVQRALRDSYFKLDRAVATASHDILERILRQQADTTATIQVCLGRLVSESNSIRADMGERFEALGSRVTSMERVMESWRPRRRIGEATRRGHVKAADRLGGRCPCCQLVVVVREGQRTDAAVFDHFFRRDLAKAGDTWLICRQCNQRRETDPAFRQQSEFAFRNYQYRKQQLENEDGEQFGLFNAPLFTRADSQSARLGPGTS